LGDFFQRTNGTYQKYEPPIYFRRFKAKNNLEVVHVEHHLAHAASSYYTSGITSKTIIVTSDGIGDGISIAVWRGSGGKIEPLYKVGSEGSLGSFYAAVTEALGWWAGDGEGKTMGLAPYGSFSKTKGVLGKFVSHFSNGRLLKPHNYGNPSCWPEKGAYHWHLPDSLEIKKLVDNFSREDIAAEAQRVIEEEMGDIIFSWLKREETRNICCAGGLFLNVKLNQRIWYSGKADKQHIFPNAGDGGLAAGAALYTYYNHTKETEMVPIDNVYWGPEFTDKDIEALLKERNLSYKYCDDISSKTARLLSQGKIVGWFQGRMESGPRALGNRSILMSADKLENKDIINSRVKFREAFRPFCPSMISESAGDYLVNYREEPYMITSFDVRDGGRNRIPAVVHVDGTVRPQTVQKEVNPKYRDLIDKFGNLTGDPVLLNTSFNIKGDPIVCDPRQAIKCFYDTGLDALVLGNFLLIK
jgi:carbamoyltransferase